METLQIATNPIKIPPFHNPHRMYHCSKHKRFFRFHKGEGIPYCPQCKVLLMDYLKEKEKKDLEKFMKEYENWKFRWS